MLKRIALSTLLTILAGVLPANAGAQGAPPKPMQIELTAAAAHGRLAAVRALLAKGAKLEIPDFLEITPLGSAAMMGHLDVAAFLIDRGANLEGGGHLGTPLMLAALSGNTEMVRLLIARGAKTDVTRPDRMTPLIMAATAGREDMVAELLRKTSNVNTADNGGATALTWAARNGHAGVAKLLLENGADANHRDNEDWTPLMHAATNGHVEAVRLLAEARANLEARDKRGRTALLLTASYGDHPEVAKALLEAGASSSARDDKGRTAAQLANSRGYRRAAQVFAGAGGAVSTVGAETAKSSRDAVRRALALIESSATTFVKRTGCGSCHNEGIGLMTTGLAKRLGHRVSAPCMEMQARHSLGQLALFRGVPPPLRSKRTEVRKVMGTVGGDMPIMLSTLLAGLADSGVKPDATTSVAAKLLASQQESDGSWIFGGWRGPMQQSNVAVTAYALRSLEAYLPKAERPELRKRKALALKYLLQIHPGSNEDYVFRVIAMRSAGADARSIERAAAALLKLQRVDGGWAQREGGASDAYATGQALYALRTAGRLPASHSAVRKGIGFLLRTQDDPGSWYMPKTVYAANDYFNSGFPYGHNQYISHLATCWAAMALMLDTYGQANFASR